MTEWKESIWLGVSALVAAMVLTFGSILASISRDMGRVRQEEVNGVEIIKEYRKYNRYDGTTVYPQDVASLVLETRGTPEVRVDTAAGAAESWTLHWGPWIPAGDTSWLSENINTWIPGMSTYSATVVKDANGAIVRFDFRRN